MFGEFTKRFVLNMAPGGSLIPNKSLHDSNKINGLQLVIVKKRSFLRRCPKHRFHRNTLGKLLTDQSLTPELEEKDYIVSGYTDVVDAGQKAEATVEHQAGTLGARTERARQEKAKFSKLKIQTAKMDKLKDSDTTIEVKEHLVPRLKEGEVLAVVTEKIYAAKSGDVKLVQRRTEGASLVLKNLKKLISFGVLAEVQANRESTTSYTVQEGAVLAYSLTKIDIQDHALEFECDHDDGITEGPMTSNNDSNLDTGTQQLVIRELLPSDDTFHDSIDTIKLHKELQEMEMLLKPLADLPLLTRSALFQNFLEVLKDRGTLSELEDTLDQWCDAETCDLPKDPSARAIVDLLTNGRAGPSPLLKAAHLLVDTMDMLPDPVQAMLASCSADVLRGLNTLVIAHEANGQPPPCQSLPLPLQEGGEFHWATELLCLTNEPLGELSELCAEMEVFLLALCTSVKGLCMVQCK